MSHREAGATQSRLTAFARDGFVRVPQAVDPAIVNQCKAVIHEHLVQHGVSTGDPGSWKQPVVRFVCPERECFAQAGSSEPLWSLYDQLLGPGNWIRRLAVGGTVPVRFPSQSDPGDAGWHIDGSYEVDGRYYVNVYSSTRALLALFLFSDVGEHDAPTEIAIGSHHDIPPLLAPYGNDGVFFGDLDIAEIVARRPRAVATGKAGDVYVCHPFLVHRATWPHRGTQPRIIAQPEIGHEIPFQLNPSSPRSLVEQTILESLQRV